MCQHADDEGMVIDPDLRHVLFQTVGFAIKELPDTAAISVNFGVDDNHRGGGGGGVDATRSDGAAAGSVIGAGDGAEWKVEGTNATTDELWSLDALLQRYCVWFHRGAEAGAGRCCVYDGPGVHVSLLLWQFTSCIFTHERWKGTTVEPLLYRDNNQETRIIPQKQ